MNRIRLNWAKAPRVPVALPWIRSVPDGDQRRDGKSKWHLLAERRHGVQRWERTPRLHVLTRCGEDFVAYEEATEAISWNNLPIPPSPPTQLCSTCERLAGLILNSRVV